jgi:predicted Zn-dependent protease
MGSGLFIFIDLEVEKNSMHEAMKEYHTAMKMFPQNLEMQYWTAITLSSNKHTDMALPILKRIVAKDSNWKNLPGDYQRRTCLL